MAIQYDYIEEILPREIFFITTQELADMFPDNTPKEREYFITKAKGAVCIMQIGDKLENGEPHDGRAPDYDDWALNADILVYYPVLDIALELSSMGIRVDKEALLSQLEKAGCPERAESSPQRRAALHHRRRYRSVPYLYVLPAQGAHRRSTVLHLARGNPQRSGSPRNPAAVNNRTLAERTFYCHE